jgi:hypothetical protein
MYKLNLGQGNNVGAYELTGGEFHSRVNFYLAEFNGRDLPDTAYVEFDNKDDATYFLLKYS